MSEEAEVTEVTEVVEGKQEKAPELPKDIQERLEELDRLKAHQSKLLDETKTAKQRAQELEESQRKAEEEQLQKDQQFKELYEREQKSKHELSEKYNTFEARVQKQEISLATNKLISELTRDTSRAELLTEKAQQFARYTENGVIYEMGGVQVNEAKVTEHLKERYPFLVDGSGASGGGAVGTGRPGGAGDSNTAAQAAKSKGDLNGYLTAHLKQ